jgi:hypothetical protein
MNSKPSWFSELDELLRGDKARALLESQGTSAIRLGACVGAAVVLGVAYGLFMGLYAMMTRTPACWEQLLCTAIKVPALFLCTLVVTFPSLYVFSALLGARLRFLDVLRVLVAAITLNLCVLAAFGPITGFFTISTTSYAFMKLLNVVFFAVSGGLGLGFLVRVLRRLEDRAGKVQGSGAAGPGVPPALPIPPVPGDTSGGSPANQVLVIWLIVYALVGAQMGWVLRPFIGDPAQPFHFFRAREANIFIDVVRSLGELFR